MINIYDLSKSDFDKQAGSNNESTNNEITKLFKNVPESEYNIIMRILKRANTTPTTYCSQSYADFMSNISSLDNDGYVKLFKELLNAYEISTKDVLSMNESRLIIFNKLRDAQNVYKEKFKDGKIKIEDAHAEDGEGGEDGEDVGEECVVDKSTAKSKTKKSTSKSTEPKSSEPKTTKATKTLKEEPVAEVLELKETSTKGKKKKEEKVVEVKEEEEVKEEVEVEEVVVVEPKEKGKRTKKSK